MNYVQIYSDSAGEWRWRFVAGNNRVMADSSEGYKDRRDLYDALEQVFGSYLATVPTAIPTEEAQEEEHPVALTLVSTGGAHLPVIAVA